MMMKEAMIIIGGGVTGLATAIELADAGVAVTLIEARHLGAMASLWTLGGVRQSGRHPAELPLAIAALKRWAHWHEELGGETGYRQRGNLRLARDEGEIESLKRMVADQMGRGLDLHFLPDHAAIRAVSPVIGETILAASFCPGDGHADPPRTVATLAQAVRRKGVTIHEACAAHALVMNQGRITGVETSKGRLQADRVILCNGVHVPELLAPLGITLPLSVQRVCVAQTVPHAACFDQVFGVANADCAGRQEWDGRFRFTTGIDDWQGDVAHWTPARLSPPVSTIGALIARATRVLPVLGSIGLEKIWGGLIDQTPDALPVLDAPKDWPGLVIGAGFSGHGFGIAPISGAILRALALGDDIQFDLTPFRLQRFAMAPAFAPLALHG